MAACFACRWVPLLSSRMLRFTLVALLLLFSHTPAEGQFQVAGPPQPIVVAPGDDVILPCHVQPQVNVAELTVEWSLPDLQPDPNDRLSRVNYVHLYRDAREDLDMKISSYMRRTTLSKDALRFGDISLKITNVTLADEGRYKCFIPELKGQIKSSIVNLIVDTNFVKSFTTATPLQPTDLKPPDPTEETEVQSRLSNRSRLIIALVSCSLLILVGAVAAYLTRRHQKPGLLRVPSV